MKGDERLPKAMGLGITARLLHVFSREEIEKILRDHVDEGKYLLSMNMSLKQFVLHQ